MMFELSLGLSPEALEQTGLPARIIAREAVRAVICQQDRLLLVQTVRGDYKFPGGGLSDGEDHAAALRREVREETGYQIDAIGERLGVTVERMADRFEPGAFFVMTSHYYAATVATSQGDLELDEYEAEMDFKPVWIEPAAACAANEAMMTERQSMNRWVPRETAVLKQLTTAGAEPVPEPIQKSTQESALLRNPIDIIPERV